MSFNFVTNSLHRKKVEIRKMELYYFLKWRKKGLN
jgi:hypothetical protein